GDEAMRDNYRRALESAAHARTGETPGLEPHQRAELAATRARIRELLSAVPTDASSSTVISADYRDRLAGIERATEALLTALDMDIRTARLEADAYYRRAFFTLLSAFGLSLTLLALATSHLRDNVLVPF